MTITKLLSTNAKRSRSDCRDMRNLRTPLCREDAPLFALLVGLGTNAVGRATHERQDSEDGRYGSKQRTHVVLLNVRSIDGTAPAIPWRSNGCRTTGPQKR